MSKSSIKTFIKSCKSLVNVKISAITKKKKIVPGCCNVTSFYEKFKDKPVKNSVDVFDCQWNRFLVFTNKKVTADKSSIMNSEAQLYTQIDQTLHATVQTQHNLQMQSRTF